MEDLDFTFCVTYRSTEPTEVRIEGQMTLETLPLFDPHANLIAQQTPGHVLLDLHGLTFMDSLGVRGILTLWMALEQRHLRMAVFGTRQHVDRLIKHLGLDTLFPLCGTREGALKALDDWSPPTERRLPLTSPA